MTDHMIDHMVITLGLGFGPLVLSSCPGFIVAIVNAIDDDVISLGEIGRIIVGGAD